MTALLRPVITEKSLKLANHGQYTFEVDRRANVLQIENAIRQQYKATVVAVRTINVLGKERRNRKGIGRTSRWKKALVTLKRGEKISGFELETEQKTAVQPTKKATADKGSK